MPELPAADDVKVQQAVVVVIEPDGAGAGALQQRAEFLRAEAVGEVDCRLWPPFSSKRIGAGRLRRRPRRTGRRQSSRVELSFGSSSSRSRGSASAASVRCCATESRGRRSRARAPDRHGIRRRRAALRAWPRTSPFPLRRSSRPRSSSSKRMARSAGVCTKNEPSLLDRSLPERHGRAAVVQRPDADGRDGAARRSAIATCTHSGRAGSRLPDCPVTTGGAWEFRGRGSERAGPLRCPPLASTFSGSPCPSFQRYMP